MLSPYLITMSRGKTKKVMAPSMKAVNDYCNDNGYIYWIAIGMQSRSEMANNKNLEVVGVNA